MCSISNTGATTRADCPNTTPGDKYSHSGTRVLQTEISKTGQHCATTEAAEPEDLQVPFAWWLPPHDSTIWYNRLVLYSASKFFLASGQMRCLILIIYQSEREHRTSKGRHIRTNGRSIPQQLSKIEQRQRRIRMIRENLNGSHLQRDPERIVVDPNTRYNMGTSQNLPVHIPTFLQRNEGDPAIKVRILLSLSTCSLPLTHLAHISRRVFCRSWKNIYILGFKQHLRRPLLLMTSLASVRLQILGLLMKPHTILCSSRVIAYTTTNFSDSTSLHMTCGAGQTSSTRGRPDTTSCYLRTVQTVPLQTRTPSCMHGSWVHTMQTWSIVDLGCGTIGHDILISCGFDGTKLLIQGLQDGVIPHWILFASLLYTTMNPSALWIQ